MTHLLVTNDFPPKVGGIQSYLWELWRRLPMGEAVVFTTPYADTERFDAAAPMPIIRSKQKVLLPSPRLVNTIEALARANGASFVVLDPALPVGWIGPALRRRGLPYAVVLHGAEITVPGRLPMSRTVLRRVLRGAEHVISAGRYPLAEAERAAKQPLPATVIPPGVDTVRLHPASPAERTQLREQFGLVPKLDAPLVVSSSRLVPRKGMDILIDAAALLAPDYPGLVVAISGAGRDRRRLDRRIAVARRRIPIGVGFDVRMLGRLPDEGLTDLYRAADVYAMLCRNRWRGLEQEGFGIVFVEAAACGTPQVAGASGGSAEAVLHGTTGLVVAKPKSAVAVAEALRTLLDDPDLTATMRVASRARAEAEFSYDVLAARLTTALRAIEDGLPSPARPRLSTPR